MSDILERLSAHRLVPVVVIDDASHADALAQALVDGGLPVAEVTFRTAAAADAIRAIAARGDVLVGAGTVLTPAQVDEAVAAGASYVVSPGTSRAVVERCQEHGILALPGAVTATEVQAALELGLTTVKFFPAGTSGGAKAVAALAAPFGDVGFVPTGGIGPEQPGRVPGAALRPGRRRLLDGSPRPHPWRRPRRRPGPHGRSRQPRRPPLTSIAKEHRSCPTWSSAPRARHATTPSPSARSCSASTPARVASAPRARSAPGRAAASTTCPAGCGVRSGCAPRSSPRSRTTRSGAWSRTSSSPAGWTPRSSSGCPTTASGARSATGSTSPSAASGSAERSA